MSDRLTRAGEEVARRAQEDAVERTAKRVRELLPGASVQTEGDRVAIEMRDLLSSWLTLSELRFLARELP